MWTLRTPPKGINIQGKKKKLNCYTVSKKKEKKFPAIPAEDYITHVRNKRPVRPRTVQNYENQNIVTHFARNNSQGFKVELSKTNMYKNSFFPMTVRDWNNLDESTVSTSSIKKFKDLFLIPHQN